MAEPSGDDGAWTALDLLADLHADGDRQGPGSDAATDRAVSLAALAAGSRLRVADLGCGTGASTLRLAETLDAEIVAVDALPRFLDLLEQRARSRGVSDRIRARPGSMDELDLAPGSLDAIWSEGAVYNIGFERGARIWRRFLKPGGVLAVSEITWFTDERPEELDRFWRSAYPEIDTASSKLRILEESGYAPLGYFALPESCWLEHYYRPLERRFEPFLERHGHRTEAVEVVETERREIALYERFSDLYGYGFYVARKRPEGGSVDRRPR